MKNYNKINIIFKEYVKACLKVRYKRENVMICPKCNKEVSDELNICENWKFHLGIYKHTKIVTN